MRSLLVVLVISSCRPSSRAEAPSPAPAPAATASPHHPTLDAGPADPAPATAIADARPSTSEPAGRASEPEVGQFATAEQGWATESKGDPFLTALSAELVNAWQPPATSPASTKATGCVQLTVDGPIAQTKMETRSGDAAFDAAATRALEQLRASRAARPVPVPTHLIETVTTRWLCFRMHQPGPDD
jgi:hypothetical protein